MDSGIHQVKSVSIPMAVHSQYNTISAVKESKVQDDIVGEGGNEDSPSNPTAFSQYM